jgi:hypothetical protein
LTQFVFQVRGVDSSSTGCSTAKFKTDCAKCLSGSHAKHSPCSQINRDLVADRKGYRFLLHILRLATSTPTELTAHKFISYMSTYPQSYPKALLRYSVLGCPPIPKLTPIKPSVRATANAAALTMCGCEVRLLKPQSLITVCICMHAMLHTVAESASTQEPVSSLEDRSRNAAKQSSYRLTHLLSTKTYRSADQFMRLTSDWSLHVSAKGALEHFICIRGSKYYEFPLCSSCLSLAASGDAAG